MATFENESEAFQDRSYRQHLDRNWENGNKKFEAQDKRMADMGETDYPGSNEVTQARIGVDGTSHDTLNGRLDDNELEVQEARGKFETLGLHEQAQDNDISYKASKDFVRELMRQLIPGRPQGTYATLNDLKKAYPNGTTGIYVTTDNGHWCYWNGGWKDGGVYQTASIVTPGVFQKPYPMHNTGLTESNILGTTWYHVVGKDSTTASKGMYFDVKKEQLVGVDDKQIEIEFDIISEIDQTIAIGVKYQDSGFNDIKTKRISRKNLSGNKVSHIDVVGAIDSKIEASNYQFYFVVDYPKMGAWHATNFSGKLKIDSVVKNYYGDSFNLIQNGDFSNQSHDLVIKDDDTTMSLAEFANKHWLQFSGGQNSWGKVWWIINPSQLNGLWGKPFIWSLIHKSGVTQNLSFAVQYIYPNPLDSVFETVGTTTINKGEIKEENIKFSFKPQHKDKATSILLMLNLTDKGTASDMITDISVKPDFEKVVPTPEISAQSSLPEVYLNGDMSGMSKDNKKVLSFELRRSGSSIKGYAQTKWQGNSSLMQDKKAYRIKTYTDEELTNKLKFKPKSTWIAGNKWNLKAYATDATHIRDIAAANLGTEIWSTDYKSLLADNLSQNTSAFGFVDGFPVNLYLNGDYAGLYSFNIPKGDYGEFSALVEGASYSDVSQFKSYPEDGIKFDGTDFSLEEPDELDEHTKDSFNKLAKFIATQSGDEFKNHLSEVIDIPSAIDYYIFSNLIQNYDAWGKNIQFINTGWDKWYVHPYDLDSTLGGEWDGSLADISSEVVNRGNQLFKKLEANFADDIKARYKEIRQWLTLPHFLEIYRNKIDEIGEGNYQLEFEKWKPSNVDSYTWQQLQHYIRKRIAACDKAWLD